METGDKRTGPAPPPTGAAADSVTAPRKRKHHAPADEPPPATHRYEPREILGSGGEGIVHRVFDRELERDVALKTLRLAHVTTRSASSFLREARAAASLQHPNIVPIHDVGMLADGRPYYTMRLVSGSSLSHLLRTVSADAAPSNSSWTGVRLAQVLQQVCMALQCAHESGIVHRDVKPANIIVSDLDEVLLVDWGIARSSDARAGSTASGIIKGTISHMSPEQARAETIDARTDIYSVGVILYQALTGRLPFAQDNDADRLAAILRDPPPPITADEGPFELSDLAMRCLAKDRADRPASARMVRDELQAFLEGVRERDRRASAATRLTAAGASALARHSESIAETARLEAEVERLRASHPPWRPVAEKRDLLEASDRLQAVKETAAVQFFEALNRYTDALAHDSEHGPARQALARMHWQRFSQAEAEGDAAGAALWRSGIERYHDGSLARELAGHGSVRVAVRPARATWTLHPFVERDLVLVDGEAACHGVGDVTIPELPMGRYVLIATAEGCEPARYPISIERNTAWEGELTLLSSGRLPEGFTYIPGTTAALGGDRQAATSWPLRRVTIESFAIAQHPVTFGEYCEYLDAMDARGEDAGARQPRVETEGALCERGADGRYEPIADVLWSPRVPDATQRQATARLPAFGVTHDDALAFAAWRAERAGLRIVLPTAEQWELAARGVDRRIHPWGDRFDATLAQLRDTNEVPAALAPIGARPTDCSPYGVRDMAGCIMEWTASPAGGELVEIRGASFGSAPSGARCAWRSFAGAASRTVHLGFRLTLQLN